MRKAVATQHTLSWILAVAFAATASVGANGDQLELKRAVRVMLPNAKPALSIDYEYSFPSRPRVHIRNLGIAPGSGRFSYVTTDDALVIEDHDSRAVLRSMPLRETIIVATRPPMTEIANETEFPAASRSYSWRSNRPISECANVILGKYFRYRAFEQEGHSFLVTTFTELHGLPKRLVGEVALLVSFPYNATTGMYEFRIQQLVREGRSHSDSFRSASDKAVIKKADELVKRIATEMQHWSGS